MKHIKEFSRFADVYADYNSVQKRVAKELLELLDTQPKRLVDLGCGSGTLYKELNYKPESFLGVDLSVEMLNQHPKDDSVQLLCQSFDSEELFTMLAEQEFDFIISSASLQWSKDLELLFKRIQQLQKPFALTLFTNSTFKTLHQEAQTDSPLHAKELIRDCAKKYLDVDVVFKEYMLKFNSNKELFNYLKKSGVSGNERQLNFRQTKKLMKEYPVDYLEFEVAFIVKNSA